MGFSFTLTNVLTGIPTEIVDYIEKEFLELQVRFSKRDWGPAELNAARFGEAILRYLEWKDSGGSYTPFDTQLKRQAIVNRVSQNVNLHDGIRFHVLKCVEILLDVRNKRDVAHLGTVINVNEMDSRLLFRLTKWVLSEIIREEASINPSEIQRIIDSISTQEIPLVDEIEDEAIVVGTHLVAIDRALVLLYYFYPEAVEIERLRKAVGYRNSTRFRGEVLKKKANDAIIFIKNGNVHLTKKGVAWVEKNINMQLVI